MSLTYPGTAIETSSIEKGGTKQLFRGIFATGGITLSQASVMTGLDPYAIQNWVKRGYVPGTGKRTYTAAQFARILIINMLRESMQLDNICRLLRAIGGLTADPSDDVIGDEELYHLFCDIVAEGEIDPFDDMAISAVVERAVEGFAEYAPGGRECLSKVLRIMMYAYSSSRLHDKADILLSELDAK